MPILTIVLYRSLSPLLSSAYLSYFSILNSQFSILKLNRTLERQAASDLSIAAQRNQLQVDATPTPTPDSDLKFNSIMALRSSGNPNALATFD